ncbi:MAG TPA: hypothetical protein VK090_08755, partial [Paracoccaceae bacterium]|nr:hypothetical protein [Paracoccaceae bacterium]
RTVLVWALFWLGRSHWYYQYRSYSRRAERGSGLFKGTQKGLGLIGNIKKKLHRDGLGQDI